MIAHYSHLSSLLREIYAVFFHFFFLFILFFGFKHSKHPHYVVARFQCQLNASSSFPVHSSPFFIAWHFALLHFAISIFFLILFFAFDFTIFDSVCWFIFVFNYGVVVLFTKLIVRNYFDWSWKCSYLLNFLNFFSCHTLIWRKCIL